MRLRACALLLPLLSATALCQELRFAVSWDESLLSTPFSGRVTIFLGKGGEPRFGPNWFNPSPMYTVMVKGAKPGAMVVVDADHAVGFPGKLSDLKPGEYTVQAVVDRNLGGRSIGESAGNLYSEPFQVKLDTHSSGVVSIRCTKVVAPPIFRNTAHVREFAIESKLLSAFYHRPTKLRAAITLPDAWLENDGQKFPILYEVPGFGGDHWYLSGRDSSRGADRAGTPFLLVTLDPNCPLGHSVFADSANNGPWGAALTQEFIPAIEKKYRAIGAPGARYVTGHSSGGWSSLWLQVAYPDVFGAVWSTSPDPVDFRDFQRIDLYDSKSNMFVDSDGAPRPLARIGDKPFIFYKKFSDMERPLRGEQLGSFEAVFSEKGSDGEPKKLWNRDTGAIDATVAESWKKYDIDLILRTNWQTLGPKLKGKLHVYTGDMDTFYLEGAVKLLKKDLADLHSDAVIDIVPGDHGSMMTPELRKRIDSEMAARYAVFQKTGQ